MQRDLQDKRKSYEKGELLESDIPADPLELFHAWYKLAEDSDQVDEANAMTLSTLGLDGFPKARIVLLKEVDGENLIFYTNYTSEKARSIAAHSKVCLKFFWPALEKQIIIKAHASKATREKSAAYFSTRPRGSQLSAWVSHQSSPIESRDLLEKRKKDLEVRFRESEIPLPENWGGMICTPESIEFWQGRQNRLHDRILFTKAEGTDRWTNIRLQP